MKWLIPILALMSQLAGAGSDPVARPNIVIIYADDLGIGDVSAYRMGTLTTPNIDRLAHEGLRFNRAYAASATCTPSRYGLLTGRYPWRTEARVLDGNEPLLIDPTQSTLPGLLQKNSYRTGVVGKWHLGMGDGMVDWNKPISPGANDLGFDYSFLMPATNDRVPTVYVKNGLVEGLDPDDPLLVDYKKNFDGMPTGESHPELLKMIYSHGHDGSIVNGVSRIGYQKGGTAATWVDEDMSDLFLQQAMQFVHESRDGNFFLFYALHQPHVPRLPHARFMGMSGMGPRGDAIIEADWAVGKLLDFLDEQGLSENTLVIFTSDNGPVLDDGYQDEAVELVGAHLPAGPLRGGKYSLYEAGTHVPLITRWPGRIEPGVSNALVSQLDLPASLAGLIGESYPERDSQDHLAALLGDADTGRNSLVIEGLNSKTAYIEGNWVYIPRYRGPSKTPWGANIETGFCGHCQQLYDLESDPGQAVNLIRKFPERASRMKAAHQAILNGQ